MRFINNIGVIRGLSNADHAISKLRKVGFGVFPTKFAAIGKKAV